MALSEKIIQAAKELAIQIKMSVSPTKLSQVLLGDGSNGNPGTLIQYDGETLAKGDVVYKVAGDGTLSILPDGSYPLKSGGTFVIADGTVSSVSDQITPTPNEKPTPQAQSSNVTYADEKNKKYPIDTEEHIRAAWNYINKDVDAKEYSPEELATVKDAIVKAWKDKIDPSGPPSAAVKADEDMASEETPVPETSSDSEVTETQPTDVQSLIDQALAPIITQIQALQDALSDCSDQEMKTQQSMSKIADLVSLMASQSSATVKETPKALNPFNKETPKDITESREYQIFHSIKKN